MRLPVRLQRTVATAAVILGAGAFGASLTGMASVDDQLRESELAATATETTLTVSAPTAPACIPGQES